MDLNIQVFKDKARLPMGMGEESKYRLCYSNAQREYHDPRWKALELRYVEGMAVLSNGDLVTHAFLVDPLERIYDVTPFLGVSAVLHVGAVLDCPPWNPEVWSCVVDQDEMAEAVRPVLLPLLYERGECVVSW